MFSEIGYITFLLLALPYIESASRVRLNEYIEHFETLDYDPDDLHHQHLRARRSTDSQRELRLDFKAHDRKFKLRLRRDLSAFSDDFKVEGSQGQTHEVDSSHIYSGKLAGDPDSTVFGSVTEGVFEGKIIAKDGSYYVEHARRYFPPNNTKTRGHSVIYKDSDVIDPFANKRHGHVGGCGITDEVVQWMERIQNSGVDDESPTSPASSQSTPTVATPPHTHTSGSPSPHPNSLRDDMPRHWDSHFHNKYSRSANTGEHARSRRAAPYDNRNTCSLFIQTDPLIWKHIREGFPDHNVPSKKNEVDTKTREEILSLISHHVTAVNYIYGRAKFDGRFDHRDIKFEVQRIKIDDNSLCNNRYPNEMNQFCLTNVDVSNFLNLHSLGNHEDFCLAYVFTYRDFTGGTLGLAWVASASGASGGICEKYKTYTETIGGMYQSTKRSLNTGIITFVNYNSRVPPKVSQLTLAHEIGHNFGSPHDYPSECRPGGQQGNYIMFASATSGDRPNNSRFSSCSTGNISAVLDAVRDGRKRNCLTASAGAFCGNKIVEHGEECDCGYDDIECTDRCCYPRQVGAYDRERNVTAKGCTRRADTECSPSQGPCCNAQTCRFVVAARNQTCREAAECSHAAVCSGDSADCPEPSAMPNHTKCNNGTQLCKDGECSESICRAWNMSVCYLSASAARGAGVTAQPNRRALCQLACQQGSDPDSCRSTADFASEVGLPTGGISLLPGSPCDNFQGYCDVFLKCRAVDAEGPLVRLKNLLLNRATLQSVQAWVTEMWWAVLLAGVALVVCMGAFVKCCAVHTPSSNPKRPPARRLSETLRGPMNTLRRMRGPRGTPARHPQRRARTHKGYAPPHTYAHRDLPTAPAGPSGRRGEPYANAYPAAYEMRPVHKV
ncbi:disintegrin and metalloproteinase domain-containing protein 10 [Bombyx mandarina]|uniref:ADAM10 endopeptidase n=2 Tax=Bombyx TaxID=7090 RepID=A0A8R2LXY1_BOMMO|nr:disintegrin and metalloproteinase domain-containing protein 10 [Bombyx mandarina]XP_037868922.1 disintegrin and metalloproteinase domain-containing protein 10 [Bombyx mori]XP_037868923.1 disintegrin and metalloproteinase domain-containing protein 10 [Bombyx mori]